MGNFIYYFVFLLRQFINLCCILLITRVFFHLNPKPAIKRLFIVFPLFLALLLLCAYSYTLREFSPILQFSSFLFDYAGFIFFFYACFTGVKKEYLPFFIAYLLISNIIIQTGLIAFDANVYVTNMETTTQLNLVDIFVNSIVLALLILIDKQIIFKKRTPVTFILPTKMSILIICALFSVGLLESAAFHPNGLPVLTQIIAVIIIALLVALIVGMLHINNSRVVSEKMVDVLSRQIEAQISHYKDLKDHDDELRGFRHDFKEIITYLKVMLTANDTESALKYIENINIITQKEDKLFDSGNYIADAMLADKNQKAKEYNTSICFDGFIPTTRIPMLDLCIILSNAIDNAIEACAIVEGSKIINIHSKIRVDSWFLFIDNPVLQQVNIFQNTITTTKKDKAIHGFGLRNIDRIVQKHKGKMHLKCENGIFSFQTMLLLDDSYEIEHWSAS